MTLKQEDELVLVLEPEGAQESDATDLVELLLQAQAEREAREKVAAEAHQAEPIAGVVIGRIVAIKERGPIVTYPDCPSPSGLAARTAAELTDADVGRRVALLFEGGDPGLPMLMGLIHGDTDAHPAVPALEVRETPDSIEVVAKKAISVQCGAASVTITPCGKIVLRGKYLLSRAAGVNRIRGGSVQIN